MKKFLSLALYRLKNSQHFDFHEACIAVARAASFMSAKVIALLTKLETAHGNENALFMKARASEKVAQRKVADQVRDDRYSRLHRLVLTWAGSGIEPQDAAATALKRLFDLYKLDTKAQVNEESGIMTNLGIDLGTDDNLARIEAIGGRQLYNEMIAANEQVKSLRIDQGEEESQKVLAALKKARLATDEAYNELCQMIESAANFADDPAPYEAFIQKWNGTIKLYQDMLDRKSGTTGSGSGSGGQEDEEGENNGSGSGSGTVYTGTASVNDAEESFLTLNVSVKNGKIIALTAAACDQEHIHILADVNTNIPDRTAAILHGGTIGTHKAIGTGQVKGIDGGFIVVVFGVIAKKFQFPG